MVRNLSESVIKLKGREEVYHIEVDAETTSKALTSTDDLIGFSITYTCPHCLSKNSSKFTSFPKRVSVFCSSCSKSYSIYNISDDSLVLMTEKLGKLIRGVRELYKEAKLEKMKESGNLSSWRILLLKSSFSVINNLRIIILAIGLSLVSLSFYTKYSIYLQLIGMLVSTVGVLNPSFISCLQVLVKKLLSNWIQQKSEQKISAELLEDMLV